MARSPLFLAVVAGCIVCVGCASGPVSPGKTAASAPSATPTVEATASRPSESAPQRRVGDFFVHRFSGSFAQDPLTLTEEVSAREDAAWVVDFALTEQEKVQRLRVRFDVKSGQAVSASHLQGSKESPATLADYETLMARTTYSADVNDGLVSSTKQSCMVGTDALDCETKTYKVWVGERPATLSVVHTDAFADRDVSGEIATDDGKLIYRAELLEARAGKPARGVASR